MMRKRDRNAITISLTECSSPEPVSGPCSRHSSAASRRSRGGGGAAASADAFHTSTTCVAAWQILCAILHASVHHHVKLLYFIMSSAAGAENQVRPACRAVLCMLDPAVAKPHGNSVHDFVQQRKTPCGTAPQPGPASDHLH